MFLSVEQFLSYFDHLMMSKEEFVKKFIIKYKKPKSLHEIFQEAGKKGAIIKNPETDIRFLQKDELVEYFYEILIRNREKYLRFYYEAYWDFVDPRKLKWSGVDLDIKDEIKEMQYRGTNEATISVQKNDASRRIIRNLFNEELLDLTKVTNTVKSNVSFWKSFLNMYNLLELEDRFFAPSSIGLFLRAKRSKKQDPGINYNNLFYLFQAYQPKASIFNPYALCWILNNKIASKPASTLFTPVLSWGSYLVAMMHSPHYKHYVGVDVMPSVCKKTQFLADYYHSFGKEFSQKKVDIYCSPSEDLLHTEFPNKYREYFDTILVCPPYFNMEIYHEGEQSIDRYPNYQDWLVNYWGATVELCAKVIKPSGYFGVIANDYNTLDKKEYLLTQDLHGITSKLFELKQTFYLMNRTSPLRMAKKTRTERLFIYQLRN